MSTGKLTRDLAAFISGLDARSTPAEARRRAIGGFIDCIGVMTAGAKEDSPTVLRRVVAKGRGAARLWPDGERAAPSDAALVNGAAAHALDYDDTGLKGHPSAVIVPAIMAAAESAGASGARMITAYLAGYETWAELISREQDQHPSKGWHITGIFGAIAATAACASLRGLDAAATTTALALAASQSSGVLANFGTMAKPLHAGLAARAGIFSVDLAAAGFGASPDALEHPQGFLAAVSPAGRFDAAAPVRAGKEWRMLSVGLNVKKYPMCYCTHRPIDGALDLRTRDGVDAADIESVEVSMSARNATILRHHTPKSELQARFSIEFAMAAAFTSGQVGLEQLSDGYVQRADVQAFFPRVSTKTDIASDPITGHSIFDKLVVRLRNGRVLESGEIRAARGAASVPLTPDEIYVKFADCVRVSRSPLDARMLFKTLMALEDAPDLSTFFAARAEAAARTVA